ncbi:ABC transporter permease [Solicola gregarius]|uniref:ABC transporter permease n=1 Tax=Solicola gregarius TaxID=2908642 RepID=A0AA46TIY8_9ACTN|nr:ABC transporter permease [Solicola gregarius]UYM05717.1 ABC transporter permease [Solicola gregarius]
MFIAWRDIRFARGRFLLVSTIVVLMTVLVGFISGLTRGLAQENTSAVEALGADRIVFSDAGGDPSYADSTIGDRQAERWEKTSGVSGVDPIGISTTQSSAGDRQETVAAFGIRPQMSGPDVPTVPDKPATVVLSEPAADALGVGTGERVKIAGDSYEVASISGEARFSHLPVVWVPISSWRSNIAAAPAHATVLAVSTDGSVGADPDGTVSTTTEESFAAIGSYASENGSLTMMTAMLYAISALVVGAFFVVWTLQRVGDLAVLKALGATTSSLVRGTLGQALIVVAVGVSIGIAVVAAMGAVISGSVPFVLDVSTTVVPGLILTVLGLIGAAASVRIVTSSDPLQALNRAA